MPKSCDSYAGYFHSDGGSPKESSPVEDYVSSVFVTMRALTWGWEYGTERRREYEWLLEHANGQWSQEYYVNMVASGDLFQVVMAAHDPRLPREALLLVLKGFWSFWNQGLPVDTAVRLARHPELDEELQLRLFGLYGGGCGLDSLKVSQRLVDRRDCSLEVLRACCEKYQTNSLNPGAVQYLILSCVLHHNADYGLLMELMLHPDTVVRRHAAQRLEAEDLLNVVG